MSKFHELKGYQIFHNLEKRERKLHKIQINQKSFNDDAVISIGNFTLINRL